MIFFCHLTKKVYRTRKLFPMILAETFVGLHQEAKEKS